MNPNDRWEQGVPHHPEAVRLLRAVAKLDKDLALDLEFGGDGDNGETLLYFLSEVMEQDERARTYKHFKGGVYTLLHEAQQEGTSNSVMVYRDASGKVWARDKVQWEEPVIWPDGQTRPRFMKV